MKREIPPTIIEPCPLSWNGMEGNAKRRFCEHCQLHVHNLSEMNAFERKNLLTSGGKLCVTYLVDNAGGLVTSTRVHWLLKPFVRLRAVFLAVIASIIPLGTSCASREIRGAPLPPKDMDTANPSPTPTPTPPPKSPVRPGLILPPSKRSVTPQVKRTLGEALRL